MKKRILSLLVVVALTFGVGLQAMGQTNHASITRGSETLFYETFAQIFADANNYADGDVIKLLADEDLGTSGVTIGKSVTLDLNGHTLTCSNTAYYAITVSNGATVTIQDSGTNGTVNNSLGDAICNIGTLIISSGSITGNNGINSNGTNPLLIVTGGSFSATGGDTWSAISIQGGTFNLSGNPTLTTPNGASAIYLGPGMVINIDAALTAPMTAGVDDKVAEGLISSFNTMYGMRLEPGIKSILTDVNQLNDSDKRLESRTDDLNAVLRIGR